ncbi:hypothetical protein LR48_Vigan192s000700 [Vigna angularis]|uniref:Uncharacterized protein n=1 Tax=Phaseolus angularis TaxID=3914 RepID=A0A0L9T6S2_PHAAN|nr:hypothetical protein LR48_Vigan192s000700 [Vigna angularis]
MGRSPCCSKEGLNKGAWTALEDKILTEYINVHGEGKWRHLPKRAGLKRCGKSCRLRWLNYLRPGIKRGNITNDEEELIIRLHNLLGNRSVCYLHCIDLKMDEQTMKSRIIGTPTLEGNFRMAPQDTPLQHDQNLKNQEWQYDKGSCLVQTKATRWSKVTVSDEISHHNDEDNKSNVGDHSKMKAFLVSPSSESKNDPVLNFMENLEMDGSFFSELLKMDFPESSCQGNKILEDNDNPSSVEKGYLSPKSSCETTHFSWGDSLYDPNFEFLPVTTFTETGFDWL